MQTTNLRHLFHIHRSKIVIIFMLFLSMNAIAQKNRGNYNYLDFQQKPYYFGITLAYNSADYKIYRSKKFIAHDSIAIVNEVNGPGFNLGIVSNLKIGEYFDLRFLPTLSFAERDISYGWIDEKKKPETFRIESITAELPFHIRYKSAPYHDIRLFVIAGAKYSFDVASNSRSRQADEIIQISPTDFTIEYGAGIQFFFPYFIFSPEFKISQGIGNLLLYNDKLDESTVLEKIFSRSFTFSLHFEG